MEKKPQCIQAKLPLFIEIEIEEPDSDTLIQAPFLQFILIEQSSETHA